ncbi:MAG: hypothetical protein FJW20_23660 [Acidimicrobiia bacterium]|nr:hypothetical protein [Acidimicrobiia bacterium]
MKSQVLLLMLIAASASAQGDSARDLTIEVAKTVLYLTDNPDYSRLASVANQVPRAASRNFGFGVFVGDIVAVNGKPARGTYVARTANISLGANAQGGVGIADIITNAFLETLVLEITSAEAASPGILVGSGFTGGPSPAGTADSGTSWNVSIQGGTGAFLGVTGQLAIQAIVPARGASATEDPSMRRTRDGGSSRFWIRLSR